MATRGQYTMQFAAGAFSNKYGIGGGFLYPQQVAAPGGNLQQRIYADSFVSASPAAAAFGATPADGHFSTNLARGSRGIAQSGPLGTVATLMDVKTGLDVARLAGSTALSGVVNKTAGTLAPSIFGTGAPAGGVVGPNLPGAATSAGYSASGLLGGAGIGYTVGSLNPLAQKETGSQIGGAIGGALGSFGGGIGVALGSFIGSTIGGFFGKGKASPASTSGINFDAAGNYRNEGVLSSKMGTEVGQAFLDEHKALLQGVIGAGGKIVADASFVGGFDKTGFVMNRHTPQESSFRLEFDINDASAASNAVVQNVFGQIDYAAIENRAFAESLQKIDITGKTVTQVLQDIKAIKPAASAPAAAPATPAYAPSPVQKLQEKVNVAKSQMEDFLDRVRKKAVGKASTILTGPLGLEEEENIGRIQLGGA